MPIAGLGLHVLIALFCAFHVVRSGQQMYWLFILFAFPLLGSIVYFFMIYLPSSRLERGALKAVSAAARALDPGKQLRLARADFEETPTAQNQMRLAAALLDMGEASEAASMYESALKGPFLSDPELRFGAARAMVECQRYNDAVQHLEQLQRDRPEYRTEAVCLLLARSYAGAGQANAAREQFEAAVERFGSFDCKAEYAIWALAMGDQATASRLRVDLDRTMARWTAANRELNGPVLRRLSAAQELAKRSANL